MATNDDVFQLLNTIQGQLDRAEKVELQWRHNIEAQLHRIENALQRVEEKLQRRSQ